MAFNLKQLAVVSAFFSFIFSLYSQAEIKHSEYYGADFVNAYETNQMKSSEMRGRLRQITSSGHKPVGYERAKEIIFGKLFLETLSTGDYAVKDVYCLKTYTDHDFGGQKTLGPEMTPQSGNVLNTEHTWPQSKFTNKFPKETQKSDLHHLFPTDSSMNSHRSNLRFGNVDKEVQKLKCNTAKLGSSTSGGGTVFEAPAIHKGNVARAMFYFAIRYDMVIPPQEEIALREWNKLDPVDEEEISRNDSIYQEQGNRNPFIDMPDLVDHLDSFSNKANQ